VRTLRRNGLDGANDPVFVQSFETANLKQLDRELDVPLVQLFGGKGGRPYGHVIAEDSRTYGQLATPAGLNEVASYADGAGPPKDYIVPRDGTGRSLAPTSFVDDAHAAGLLVHPYTFRNENAFLPLELRSSADLTAYGNAIAEYEQFFELGVDGLFSDNPDTAVEARPWATRATSSCGSTGSGPSSSRAEAATGRSACSAGRSRSSAALPDARGRAPRRRGPAPRGAERVRSA
jgi:glycerophosphoryl diester phosphodiesterase